MTEQKITNNIENQICELYQHGKNGIEIGAILNVHPVTVYKYLKRNKIKAVAKKKYNCNELVFNTLDSEEKKYWVGFIAGDGCIKNGRGYRLAIGLNIKDIKHLEKFLHFANSNHKIHIKNNGNAAYVEISSKNIVEDLSKYNIKPNKTLVYKAPDVLLDSADFWRGLIDADGWLNIYNNNPRIGLCGSKMIIKQFNSFVKKHAPAHMGNPLEKNNYSTLEVNGKNAIKIIKFLYQDANIFLDRKYEKALWVIKNKGA